MWQSCVNEFAYYVRSKDNKNGTDFRFTLVSAWRWADRQPVIPSNSGYIRSDLFA
jgi:hypothetical protein